VLVSGLYLLGVTGFVSVTFPSPEGIVHSNAFYSQLSPELQKRILGRENLERLPIEEKKAALGEARRRGLIQEVKMPNGHVMAFSSDLPIQDTEAVAKAYWSIIEKESRQKRVQYVLQAFLWWIGPVIVMYGFGWSVGWVYRGFRKQ
jgi:hypothetical protein